MRRWLMLGLGVSLLLSVVFRSWAVWFLVASAGLALIAKDVGGGDADVER